MVLYLTQKNYQIKKDGYEHLEITYSMEARPCMADYTKIIIGTSLISYNRLLLYKEKTLKNIC